MPAALLAAFAVGVCVINAQMLRHQVLHSLRPVCLQGSGSQLATCSMDLVRPRPGLHPGDLTLKPDASAVELERQRMAKAAYNASSDLVSSPTDGRDTSSGETCGVQQASPCHVLHTLIEFIVNNNCTQHESPGNSVRCPCSCLDCRGE